MYMYPHRELCQNSVWSQGLLLPSYHQHSPWSMCSGPAERGMRKQPFANFMGCRSGQNYAWTLLCNLAVSPSTLVSGTLHLISGTVHLISGTVHFNKWDRSTYKWDWNQCRSAQRTVATDLFLHLAVYTCPPPFNRNRKYVVPFPVPFISSTVPLIKVDSPTY